MTTALHRLTFLGEPGLIGLILVPQTGTSGPRSREADKFSRSVTSTRLNGA